MGQGACVWKLIPAKEPQSERCVCVKGKGQKEGKESACAAVCETEKSAAVSSEHDTYDRRLGSKGTRTHTHTQSDAAACRHAKARRGRRLGG